MKAVAFLWRRKLICQHPTQIQLCCLCQLMDDSFLDPCHRDLVVMSQRWTWKPPKQWLCKYRDTQRSWQHVSVIGARRMKVATTATRTPCNAKVDSQARLALIESSHLLSGLVELVQWRSISSTYNIQRTDMRKSIMISQTERACLCNPETPGNQPNPSDQRNDL